MYIHTYRSVKPLKFLYFPPFEIQGAADRSVRTYVSARTFVLRMNIVRARARRAAEWPESGQDFR